MNPVAVAKRIDVLDYLRGFALLGIILVNILPLLAVKLPSQGSADASYQRFLFLFVEGRFYTLFSFLFGVGFYLFISRANAKGEKWFPIVFPAYLNFVHLWIHPCEVPPR